MGFILFLIASALIGFGFYTFPIDAYVSDIFFDVNNGFKNNALLSFLHQFVYFLMGASLVTVSSIIAFKFYNTRSFVFSEYRKLIYLLMCFIIGPGLIINMGFKEHSHRPRPSQTNIFNGANDYTPPFDFSGQCKSNCSFVSGHASVGFMFFAFAFLHKDRSRRRLIILLSSLLGMTFGIARIMQGSHYLSDIIFSGVFVFITTYVIAKIMKPDQSEA